MRASWLMAFMLALGAPAAAATYEVVVTAAATSYTDTPVTITVPAPPGARSAVLAVVTAGDPFQAHQQAGAPSQARVVTLVPCDTRIEGSSAEVTWILDDLAQGASRTYRLTFIDTEPDDPGRTASGVTVHEDRADLWVHGARVTSYNFVGAPKPFLQPINDFAAEASLTRWYPTLTPPGESTDHPHHRSLWFTHGDVNGIDFWTESPRAGRIMHRSLETGGSGRALAWLRAHHDWLAPDGSKVCEGTLELRLYVIAGGRLMDFDYSVTASEGPLKFGDTKEGTFGIRVADSMRVRGGEGHILNSAGQRDGETWGKRAAWCDYSGPVDGKVMGIAVLDHPENLRHPTYWHVRDYGLFAANPFGVHDFTGQPGEPGAHTLAAGEKLTLRYRLFIHAGWGEPDALQARWEQFARPPQVSAQPLD